MEILGTGKLRHIKGFPKTLRDTMAFMTGIYLIFAIYDYPDPLLHRPVVFGVFLAMVFLTYASPGTKADDRVPIYDYLLALCALSVSFYFIFNLEALRIRAPFVEEATSMQILFAFMAILLVLEGIRRISGIWIPVMCLLALIYLAYGHLIPGRFGHLEFSLSYMVDGLFLNKIGLWGVTMGAASGPLLIIILFSTFLMDAGFSEFLSSIMMRFTQGSYGGFAKVSILSSALFGMISGGGANNVSVDGAITIPGMIRNGYSPVYAAAVESTASMASAFTPPVLGTVAFLMAEVAGIPYSTIALAAIIPATLFYISLYILVDVHARRLKIQGEVIVNGFSMHAFKTGFLMFSPIIYFVFRMIQGGSISRIALESIGVILIVSLFMKKYRFNLVRIIKSVIAAMIRAYPIVITMAASGILIGVINLTGLASKFSTYLLQMRDAPLILILFIVMLVVLFLGLALSISTSYLISVVFFVPILINRGLEPLAVHMFLLYFSAIGSITPPVAITSLTAATIAGASPTHVGFMAMRLSSVSYLIPFLFILHPDLLLIDFNWLTLVLIMRIAFGTIAIVVGIENWLFTPDIPVWARFWFIASGLWLMFDSNPWTLAMLFSINLFYGSLRMVQKKRTLDMQNEK